MLKDYFLITRPYSLVDLALVGLLANIIAVGTLIPDMSLLLDITIPLLFWISFLYLTETKKKRINISLTAGLALLIIPIALIFFVNPLSLIFLPFALAVLYVYSQKNYNKGLGLFSFLSRGLFTVLAFITVVSLHGFNLLIPAIESHFPLVCSLFLLSSSRNLVGDMRDYAVDRYTFPKIVGRTSSLAISSIMLVLVILLFMDISLLFPIYIFLLILLITQKNAFNLHKLFVLTTTFFFMNYLMLILSIPPIFNNVLYLSAVLNFTYNYVPRSYVN
jgi:hypothetical protein